MKRTLTTILFAVNILIAFSQNNVPLKFNSEGNFKIVQFTDTHFKYGNPASDVALQLINEVMDAEKPDLVVYTGDMIYSKPAKEGLDAIFAPVVDRGIPWAYVFGNHDDEFGMTRQQTMEYVIQKPYCLAQVGDKALDGVGNYILEIKGTGDSIKSVLYFLDSKSYSRQKGVKGYDWFGFNQVDWYRKESMAYTRSNKGKPYPALAFFHIPLLEYNTMATAKDTNIIGDRKEGECNGKLNSGMFTAMKQSGDVMGVFVGHDHDNDYIGEYYGIYLAYGRYSGGKTVYNNLGLNGCRIIEMKEGQRSFSTHIRLLGGEKLYPVEYPITFAEPEKK